MAEIISLQVHERVKKMPTPQKSLPSYGEHGSIAKTLLSEATLGYYLGQLDAEDLAILSSRNQDSADLLFKRKKKDPNIQGVKTILQKAGKEIQKGNISYGSVINHLADIDLALKNGDTFFSSDLASGIWRWSNHLAERRRKKTAYQIGTTVVTAAALTGGAYLMAHKSDAKNINNTPLNTTTAQSLQVDIPTQTPTATHTPEASPTPTIEEQTRLDWDKIIQKYQTSGFDMVGSHVIDGSTLTDPTSFESEMTYFLTKNNQISTSNKLTYSSGNQDEVDIWVEQSGNITTAQYDGLNISPDWVAHTFTYDSIAGTCSATADLPLGNGDFQNTQVSFDPNNPEPCFATATTISQKRLIVGFFPENGAVTVKAVVFTQ